MTIKRFIEKAVFRILAPFDIYLAPTSLHKLGKFRDDLLNRIGINKAIDVGANKGQYGLKLVKAGFGGKIISFEPLKDVYAELVNESAKYDNWDVYERCAVGNMNGEIEINVSENFVSSSIYKVLETSTSAVPTSASIKKEKVKIVRLDDVLSLNKNDKVHLKIDVQGYEKEVLKGAANTLDYVQSLELEISLIKLYDESTSAEDLLTLIKSYGFSPVSYTSAFTDTRNGGILQLDGLFIKNDLLHLAKP